jgi:hypothetical protein
VSAWINISDYPVSIPTKFQPFRLAQSTAAAAAVRIDKMEMASESQQDPQFSEPRFDAWTDSRVDSLTVLQQLSRLCLFGRH